MCSRNNVKDFEDDNSPQSPTSIIVSQDDLTGKANVTFTGKKNEKLHVVILMFDSQGVKRKEMEIDAKLISVKESAPASPKSPVVKEKDPTPTSPKSPRSPSPKSPRVSSKSSRVFPEVPKVKDVAVSIVRGKIFKGHEVLGKDDSFVKVNIGKQSKKTHTVDNTHDPVWNEYLYFENVTDEEAANVEISILDEDVVGPPCFIGSHQLSLLEYANTAGSGRYKHIEVPLFNGESKDATLEVEVMFLEAGGGAREKAKNEEKADNLVNTREVSKPRKDVVINVGSGKIHNSHELIGKDDGFVKVVIGDVEQKTSVQDNSQNPVWNENLYFENVKQEDIGLAQVSVLDYDVIGPAHLIGSAHVSLLDYVDNKQHLSLPVHRDGKEEAILELDVEVLELGGADRVRAGAEKAEAARFAAMDAAEREAAEKKRADKAAKEKARADQAASDKAAKEKGKLDEKEAKDKAKADKEEAERQALERKKAERAAKEKAKADAERAKIEEAQAKREWELNRPKKDAIISVGSGKIYHTHEVTGGMDDGFVKVTIGGVVQKTEVIDNTQDPVWNQNLYFESIFEEDFANSEIAVYDYDILGPACLIGSANVSLSEYVDKKKHLQLPVFKDQKEEALLELDIILLACGSAAKQRTKDEADAAAKAARDKQNALDAKAAAKAAEAAAKEKAKLDKEAAKHEAERLKQEAKEAEKAAKEKAKADKAEAERLEKERKQAEKERAKQEKAAAEKAKADAKAAEKAKAKADKEAAEKAKADAKAAEKAAAEKAKEDAKAAVVSRDLAITAKGNKLASLVIVRGEVLKKGDVVGKGDPFVKVEVGKEAQQTQSCKGTGRPQWNQDMTFEHVNDLNAENVVITVLDEDTVTKNDVIGLAKLSLLSYLDNKKHVTINVLDTKGKEVVGRLELDVLLEVEGAPKKKQEGEKRAVINVKSGKVFEKQDSFGKGDPFLTFIIGCAEQKTSVKNNTQEPVWNEKLYFENVSEEDAGTVLVAIWDHDATSDTKIATATLSLIPYKGKKGSASVTLYDTKRKEQAKVELEVVLEVESP